MSQTIQCFEPQGRPIRVAIELEPGESFSIYLLQDTLSDGARGLRDTILRKQGEHPPHNAQLLFEAELRPGREGDSPSMRVVNIGRGIVIDQLRPDLRSRLTTSSLFKSGTRFEATLENLRTIAFSLEVASVVAQGAAAAASRGGSARGSKAMAGAMSAFWIVPTVVTTLADPLAKVKTAIFNAAKKAGLSPALLSPMMLMGALTVGLGYVAYGQYQGAQDAEEKAAIAEEGRVAAEAGRDAALVAEAACIEERKDLADTLDDVETKRLLQAEVALAVPKSRSVAVEIGGAVMGAEDVLTFDQQYAEQAKKFTVQQMAKLGGPPENAGRCLAMEQVLGLDLPQYILLWHPDPDLVCPDDYAIVDGGVARAGSWGISSRAAEEFGAPEKAQTDEGVAADPRMNDRWSSAALATGLRAIQEALLTADTAGRPAVAPGQVQIWSLALWDAYNRMPSPASGVMNKPAESCIQDFVLQVAAASNPSDPGEPVLPDLTAVASGEDVKPMPTAGCPWPGDAVQKGAQSAFRAVAHMANIAGAAEEMGVASGG